MHQPDLHSVTWFFSASWRTLGANWRAFLVLTAVPPVVSSALASSTGAAPAVGDLLIRVIVVVLVTILTTMALTMAAHKTLEGEVISVGESYTLSFRLFWPYIWTGILYFLIVLSGFLFFIIPGILFSIQYVAAPYLVIVEGTSGRKALSRSKALTQGRKGSILWREFACGILFWGVIFVPVVLLTFFLGVVAGNPLVGFSEPKPEWAETIEWLGHMLSEALFVVFNVLLLKDLQMLKRGF